MRGNKRKESLSGIHELRQRAPADQQRQDQRRGTVSADAAVSHDVQFAAARFAAAKTVGDIRQPVLMQAAGGEHG